MFPTWAENEIHSFGFVLLEADEGKQSSHQKAALHERRPLDNLAM